MKIDPKVVAEHIRKNGFVSSETDKGKTESSSLNSEVTASLLPESLTPAVLKEVSAFQKELVEATVDATGTVALERFEGDKDLQRVSVNIDAFGGNTVSATSSRLTEVNVGKPGGEPKIEQRFNNVVGGFSTRVAKKSSRLKQITTAHNEAGKAKLG